MLSCLLLEQLPELVHRCMDCWTCEYKEEEEEEEGKKNQQITQQVDYAAPLFDMSLVSSKV